jgi:hypothetical protein
MECDICMDNFDLNDKLPLILECGHTFCKSCLRSICISSSKCPLDKQSITKSFSSLKPNYFLLNILDKNINPQSSEEIKSQLVPSPAYQYSNQVQRYCKLGPIRCPIGHRLSFKYQARLLTCYICKKSSQEPSWNCSICTKDICQRCYDDEIDARNINTSNRLNCKKNHQLYYYVSTSEFYQLKNGTAGMIACDICNKEWRGGSWACRLCCFDMCNSCKSNLTEGIWNRMMEYLTMIARGLNTAVEIAHEATKDIMEDGDSKKISYRKLFTNLLIQVLLRW